MSTPDILAQEQSDFAGRLAADPFFADIVVLEEQRGVTEADIEQSLSTLNSQGGKMGALAIVLVPTLRAKNPNVPTPEYDLTTTVQVIDQPLFNLGADGTGKTVSQLALRSRQLLHQFRPQPNSTYTFDGQDPIAVDPGKNSLGVRFTRQGADPLLPRVATPKFSATAATAPATITITCATAGAAIWYTTNGSYPAPLNPAATLYDQPLALSAPTSLRAVALLAGNADTQQSQPATFSIA